MSDKSIEKLREIEVADQEDYPFSLSLNNDPLTGICSIFLDFKMNRAGEVVDRGKPVGTVFMDDDGHVRIKLSYKIPTLDLPITTYRPSFNALLPEAEL